MGPSEAQRRHDKPSSVPRMLPDWRERDLRELCGSSPMDRMLDDRSARVHDPNAERTLAAWLEVDG